MASGWSLASLGGRGQYSESHHYHQYIYTQHKVKQEQIPKCVAQGQREHNYGVSGRSLTVILRGGATPMVVRTSVTKRKQSQLARKEERNEETYIRGMWYGGKRGRLQRVVR